MRNSILGLTKTYSGPLSGITEPLTLAEVKDHLEITFADKDSYIQSLIHQVREQAELVCNISLVEKTIVLLVDWEVEQELPYPPVQSVSEVKMKMGYNPTGGTEWYTLDPDEWNYDGVFYSYTGRRFQITYSAGPTVVSEIPEGLKRALLEEVAWKLEHRGEEPLMEREDVFQTYKNHSWD